MRAALRARQRSCESQGRIPEETHRAFLDAGFYRILQPRRFHGLELSLTDFITLLLEVARGCPDTAWVLSLIAAAPASVLSLFPPQAQSEAYSSHGECRVSTAIASGGAALPSTAGYKVQGQWDYCTGCDIATHFIGSVALVHPLTGSHYGAACVLIDRSQFTIVDNWNMMGLQGTGSRRVVVEPVEIPEHRVLPLTGAQWRDPGSQPGNSLHSNPLYRTSPLAIADFALAAVAVGTALCALDAFEDTLHRKWSLPPWPERLELPEFQQTFGQAQALVDTAEAALLTLAERWTVLIGNPAPAALRRIDRAAAQCVELAWNATDLMFRSSGSSSATPHSPLGRAFRALAVLRTHIGAQHEHKSVNVARLHFGIAPLNPL